jgi:hypothetical protein
MIYNEAFPSCSQSELGRAATSETAAKCEGKRSAELVGNEPTGAPSIIERNLANGWTLLEKRY